MIQLRVRLHILARKTHKWLGLVIGLQVVIWSLSGLYMTAVHIDIIHGDHLVQSAQPAGIHAAELADPHRAVADQDVESLRLAWVRSQGSAGRPSGRIRARIVYFPSC